jgi:hypothetical protein
VWFEVLAMNLPLSRRRPARLRRARSNRMRVLAISATFAVLMAAVFYTARDPAAVFRPKAEPSASGVQTVKAGGIIGAGALGADDPVLQFTKTKVGQVVFSSARSDTCRRVLFDNRTGARLETGEMFCGQTADEVVEAETSNRLNSLSKSFH